MQMSNVVQRNYGLFDECSSSEEFCCFRHLERARIALDVEKNMPTAQRRLSENKYWVEVRSERYLQVEQVNNELFHTKDEDSDDD